MMKNPLAFGSEEESHNHALETLEELAKYQDFMRSIDTLCDMGCGTGRDLEWWATQTILDDSDNPIPLDIKCTGVDLNKSLSVAKQYQNIVYERRDFETETPQTEKYDVIWCHDSFQYAINPFETLKHFYNLLTPGGMFALVLPHSTNVVYNKHEFDQLDYQYYNYTLVSTIHMLAVTGFDCKSGFFKKNFEDPWISAVVYKSKHTPMDPRKTRWWDLLQKDLLPGCAEASLNKHGYLRQQDLILQWLNKSITDYGQQ